jgi:hypothetical protein
MSQITIYLDSATEKKVRRRAKEDGISVSKWIVKTIAGNERDAWPTSVVQAFGSWSDVPEQKAIRRSYGRDVQRESLD